ncbi:MAG: hypothetical protein KZQ89_17490 [Candidatus Thiodiazotropha sp. (ex Lucinoma kastoroae)]|nr:hypothetical protein [Candidatus Thiodiazotropha sp. (ex Lucinoma kastoroae)]
MNDSHNVTDKWRDIYWLGNALLLYLVAMGGYAVADSNNYRILSVDQQGEYRELGSIELIDQGDSQNYHIDWEDTQFDNHFLSMRPFKCLPHPTQLICHLPYPYKIHRKISNDDLTDLEYDMLFLHKPPQEYGINAWNGLYFKFTRRDNGFEGDLKETDLNVLQAPPEGGDLRPIDPNELYEASDKHWLRRIIIERIMPIGEAS